MKIVYVTGGFFPSGSAYASRTLNLCRAIKESGYEVVVIADYGESPVNQNMGEIEGINYILCDAQKRMTQKQRIRSFMSVFSGEINKSEYNLVISSSDHDRFSKILNIVKQKGIPIVLESCEWFGPYNWSYGIFNPRYYTFLYCWNRLYTQVDGVVAISRLLEKHYLRFTNKVIRIPTVLPETNWNPSTTKGDIVRLMYAGSAGKSKDLLRNVIIAISRLNNKDVPIRLDIYGVEHELVRKQLGRYSKILDEIEDKIVIHGRIKQAEINECYCNSDFSILFRPERRSSNAGFPTKLAESLMAGTPIICNNTGDIGLYIKNGVNGLIIDDTSVDTIYQCLLRLNKYKNEDIRIQARKTAIDSFLWKDYVDQLTQFIRRLTGESDACF